MIRESIKLKFPREHAMLYEKQLLQIRQLYFIFIREYDEVITYLLEKISLCEDMSKRELENSRNKAFFRGIASECVLKFTEENIISKDEAIRKMTRIENELLLQSTMRRMQITEKETTEKWCRYCHKPTHYTVNCLSIKSEKSQIIQRSIKKGKEHKDFSKDYKINPVQTCRSPFINLKSTKMPLYILFSTQEQPSQE